MFWQQYRPQIARQGPGLLRAWLPLPAGYADFATALLLALGFSLLIALFDGLYFEWLERRSNAGPKPVLFLWRHLIIAGEGSRLLLSWLFRRVQRGWRFIGR